MWLRPFAGSLCERAQHDSLCSQALLQTCHDTVNKMKDHSTKVAALRQRHHDLSAKLLRVMRNVDALLAPAPTAGAAAEQRALRARLDALAAILVNPQSGILARAQHLVLLQAQMPQSAAAAAGASESVEERLTPHLPHLAAHLEMQQSTIMGMVDMLKQDTADLVTIARELQRRRSSRGSRTIDTLTAEVD